MTSRQKLILELQKLNQKLDSINNSGSRFMVYNANPFKFALFNFLAGTFHSLGNLFGTIVIAALVVYLFSALNLNRFFTSWLQEFIEGTVNQIIPQLLKSPQSPFGV